MAHYKLINSDDITSGPVDYSTPVGSAAIFVCSSTVRDHIERRKPTARRFTSNDSHDSFWYKKFCTWTDLYPDFVTYARNASGIWFVQAVFL